MPRGSNSLDLNSQPKAKGGMKARERDGPRPRPQRLFGKWQDRLVGVDRHSLRGQQRAHEPDTATAAEQGRGKGQRGSGMTLARQGSRWLDFCGGLVSCCSSTLAVSSWGGGREPGGIPRIPRNTQLILSKNKYI